MARPAARLSLGLDRQMNKDSLDLRSLRHVTTLARLLSFTKAAAELGISQPVLSRSIQAIERRQNVRLFDREQGGVHVTPVGRLFVERAEALLREAGDLEVMLWRSSRGDEGELRFGIAPHPARVLLSKLVIDQTRASPHLSVCALIRDHETLLALLLSEQVEFFIASEAFFPEPPHVKGLSLGYFPIATLVRAGHPLLETPLRSDCGPFPTLMNAMVDVNTLMFVPSVLRPYLDKVRRVVVEDNEVLAAIAEQTDGVWVTSPFLAMDALAEGRLRELMLPAIDAPVRVRIMMYVLDRRSLSPAAVKVKEQLTAEIRELTRRRDSFA